MNGLVSRIRTSVGRWMGRRTGDLGQASVPAEYLEPGREHTRPQRRPTSRRTATPADYDMGTAIFGHLTAADDPAASQGSDESKGEDDRGV